VKTPYPGNVRVAGPIVVGLALLAGAAASVAQSPPARLPSGAAGRVLAHAFEAAGGWERWTRTRDVAHISTLTILDPLGNVASESIGWFKAPLHTRMRARMESIGVAEEVILGVDGDDTWVSRDGQVVDEPARLELIHFNLVSNRFWFSLPFALGEMPVTLADLGETRHDGVRVHRVKAVFEPSDPGVPGEWFVFSFNLETGLIDRVHAHISAPFLRHSLWVGKWLDYRDCDGLKKERVRKFFPADAEGQIVGTLVAEQLVEYVRLNNGFPAELFNKPVQANRGRLAMAR
jgi:hypothetical protein